MNLVGSWQWVKEGMMRKHQSVGEMISTFCFVGVSFYLLIYSLDLLESGVILYRRITFCSYALMSERFRQPHSQGSQ